MTARQVPRRPMHRSFLLALLLGCAEREAAQATGGGDAARAPEIIARYRCGDCHLIPGVDSARGRIGPPLTHIKDRKLLGGDIANTPANLMKWIRTPREIKPFTPMPHLGVTEQEARDLVAYLYVNSG